MRYKVLNILNDVIYGEKYSNLELLKGIDLLDSKDKALATNIVYGVLQNMLRIDYIIKQYSKIPLKKISPDIMNILRMGVYQAEFMDKIPPYAITNESIKLVKKCKKTSASGFVNALLRGVIRKDKEITYDMESIEGLSTYYSCPLWICKMWQQMYGDRLEGLLASMNEKPPFSVRVNTLKISVDEFLEKRGGRQSELVGDVVILTGGTDVKNDEMFEKGYYYPQDEASALAARTLAPKKGEKVIDVCAAPGGKTTYMAQLMENEGKIFAFDIYEHKLEIIEKTAKRLGVDIIHTKLNDATLVNEEFIGCADKVLVDAPCSGLGILRRKPEIRYMRKEGDLAELAEIQGRILDVSAKYVKKGGNMVYSTCTVSNIENMAVVEKFLEQNKEFSLCGEPMELLPDKDRTDGFFIAKFVRG